MNAQMYDPQLSEVFRDLNIFKEHVYNKSGWSFENFERASESAEYAASSFTLNGKAIQYRASKITPTKLGQFVTVWKRNDQGITEPFSVSDSFDFIFVTSRAGDNLGQFIFPKSVLAEKGVITVHGKDGKRGIRVYPPWDEPTSKQAAMTQRWQTPYFVAIKEGESIDRDLLEELFES